MSVQEAPRKERKRGKAAFGAIDCDVHPYFVNGIDDLAPYLRPEWRHRLGIGEQPDWAQFINGGQIGLPKNEFYRISSGALRTDAVPPGGGAPGSDPEYMAEHLLDAYDIDRAILLGGPNSGLATFPHPGATAAVAAAYNDWMCDRWLSVDTRWRGAILVAPQEPQLAVDEIKRVADRPGIAAIHMPVYNIAAGERHYHPIYEAAEHYGLPILIHPGATEAIYVKAPQLGQVPTYYLEWHTVLTQPAQSNFVSLVCHGVFERFPKLKYVFVEGGFAWVLDVLWRLGRDWKAQRDEVPWVKKHPVEYLEENIRFSTQPFPETEKPEHIHTVLEVMRAERTLLFATDYPHWDFDDPRRALKDIPDDLRQRVFVDNAVETFGDRLN